MKKITTLFFVILLSLNALAQLEVKPNSFKLVEGFVNIDPDYQYDDNNLPYAVLKIKTENINDKERHNLSFETPKGTFFEIDYHIGEVWLFISYYTSYIKFSYPDSETIKFEFPFEMQGKKGYEMTLINKTSNFSGSGGLFISTIPESGATITINGRVLEEKTYYRNPMIAAGEYEITVSKEGYEDVTKKISIYDGDKIYLDIEMPLIRSKLLVETNPTGAKVTIDGKVCGVTPLSIDTMLLGKHALVLEMNKCKTFNKEFEIERNKMTRFNVKMGNCPKGAAPGVFSVSDKKKVHFSQGLLLARYGGGNLKFANDQLSHAPSFFSSNTAWGMWETYPIDNAGLKSWSVLSDKEWNYVLFERKNPTGFSFVWANIDGKKGIILLPDDWDYKVFKLTSSNEISLDDWTNIIEPNGAVFLFNGEYWTSTKSKDELFGERGKTIYITDDKVGESCTSLDSFARPVCTAK